MIEFVISAGLFILLNFYFFFRLKVYFPKNYKLYRKIYFGFILLFVSLILFSVFFVGLPHSNHNIFRWYFILNFYFLIFILSISLYVVFILLSDILLAFTFFSKIKDTIIKTQKYLVFIATSFFLILLILLHYGLFFGIGNFKLITHDIKHKAFPESFDGLKIVHFSDTHLGSFFRHSTVKKGVELIKNQNADIVCFTGDLVNISTDEALPYLELFASITAPLGKYAVLGNHDLSDYRKFDIPRDSQNVNTLEIVKILKRMGFVVLRDSAITISSGKNTINIIGTDNWGNPPFKRTGDIDKAIQYIDIDNFNILLTHDPNYWSSVILDKYPIHITLSGHTHGFQSGYRNSNNTLSLSSLKYKHSLGLYNVNGRYINVNAGFGFIGIPARVGVKPEISVIKLFSDFNKNLLLF